MTNKIQVDAVIFIPFIAKEYDMLIDTIDSIECLVKESYHIIAVDDCSDGNIHEKLSSAKPGITVLRNERKNGGRSGLYITMAAACKYALDNFEFSLFMKMDTDALMVGPGLITQAAEYLAQNHNTGILGSYTIRADGKKRSWFKWKMAFLYESCLLRPLFRKTALWKDPLREALNHGYRRGENVLGGAYFISHACLKKMAEKGYLDYKYDIIRSESRIGDEIIYCLFCKASGFEIHDFGKPHQTMAIALDNLPLSKEAVLAGGKTVIHSVKLGKNGESQAELRRFFKNNRCQSVFSPG